MSEEKIDRMNEYYHSSYKDLERVFDTTDKIIMLAGPVNCGKEYSVKQLCFKKSKILYSGEILSNIKDLVGYYDKKTYKESQLYMAYITGGVFFINDFSQCSKQIIKGLINMGTKFIQK